jgi:pilus assembly protein TadC
MVVAQPCATRTDSDALTMNTREYATRFIAALLAMFMIFGLVLIAYEIWVGEAAGWHEWALLIQGVVFAWILAGFAFGFPGPRAGLRSLWQRIRIK